ncbi:MAG: HIT domain-containing protein [Aliidiomarina sp.]|uniref:HIT domain-containing protein n=1 Tax=Aliidiomarina sp. TaxID=1872439 RepID=UPI0025BD8929|nr:HIT domain-containing protein [Aliidiomarina sp.]MCH8501408.1 HIT domain-containing protein [Aliidiomarina sp.]
MNEFQLAEALQRDCFEVGQLPLSLVLMMNDRQYPWFILVPKRADISEIYQLTGADQQQLAHESSWFGQALMTYFHGDKLNIAALGNMVPQLHVHHIVRFRDDCAWPQPVWGHSPAIPYPSDDAELRVNAVAQIVSRYTSA